MVFSDPVFLLGFLPITLALFYLVRQVAGGEASATLLILASAVFYAWWSIPFLLMLIAQLGFNYILADRLRVRPNGRLLALGIILNLLLLGYFKYRNFFIENVASIGGYYPVLPALIVPLGISFHTFQQIAFLIAVNGKQSEVPRLKNYALFVLFFPQLVAGPIVFNHEFDPQLSRSEHDSAVDWNWIGTGAIIFLFGLFKKVCLADNMAPYVDTAFAPGLHLQPLEAWLATFSFVLQLFFDFSGYSDMAIGLGLMFGIRLPANFQDPLRATSIVEFWARWHITMTRFFMFYVYTPLSMNMMRRSVRRRHTATARFLSAAAVPTMVTFLAAGFWHGANWTFGFCGVTQGIALVINQAWRQWKAPRLPHVVGWLLTIGVFCIGQAFFRAQTSRQALHIVQAMLSPWDIRLPSFVLLHARGMQLAVRQYDFLTSATFAADVLFWNALLLVLVFALPNLSTTPEPLRPNLRLAGYAAVMTCFVLTYIGAPRSFIYFQF